MHQYSVFSFWDIHSVADRSNEFLWIPANHHYCRDKPVFCLFAYLEIAVYTFHSDCVHFVMDTEWHVLTIGPAASGGKGLPVPGADNGVRLARNAIKGFPSLVFKLNLMMCKFPANPEARGFLEFGDKVLNKQATGCSLNSGVTRQVQQKLIMGPMMRRAFRDDLQQLTSWWLSSCRN